ncbi:MAG: FAD-dependent oxidoreductase [Myxococcaceae bacterium]
MPTVDVAVVGGGPAGLALAAMAARQGLSVLLLERAPLPHDKACGEGVMPAGLAVLERLGVLDRIPATDAGPIRGVRYVQEDGSMLDGALPVLDGLTTTARLRADPTTSGIKIVMVSARAQQTDIRRGLEAGVDIYVTKPFDPAVLIRAVHQLAEARVLDVDR